MTTTYLALGSNVGDPAQYITKAIDSLQTVLSEVKQAPLYTSKAVGYTDQPNFLNTVISGQTELSPQELLEVIDKIERKLGRIKRFRWGPREIDIDIIFFGNQILNTEKLVIPHPSFRERDFVLQPLVDLNSQTTDPVSQLTVKELLDRLEPSSLSIIHKA